MCKAKNLYIGDVWKKIWEGEKGGKSVNLG